MKVGLLGERQEYTLDTTHAPFTRTLTPRGTFESPINQMFMFLEENGVPREIQHRQSTLEPKQKPPCYLAVVYAIQHKVKPCNPAITSVAFYS